MPSPAAGGEDGRGVANRQQAAVLAISPPTSLAGPRRSPPLALRVFRDTPPWLASLLVHLLVLIGLALWTLPLELIGRLELNVKAETVGDTARIDQPLVMPALEPDRLLAPVLSEAGGVEPLESLPIFGVRLQPVLPVPGQATSIRQALSGRQAGQKRRLLAAYGGTTETEHAVELGLKWLSRNQRRDGTWSLRGPYRNGAALENETAATAMAMLAFLGAGHTHVAGNYQDRVRRGARALLKMQDSDGNFYHASVDHHRLYSQAMATIAVCELFGMTRDQQFQQPAQLALDYAASIQASDGQAGGWRYVPHRDIDTSVTGWFAMALQSGRMARLEVSEPALDKISLFLDQVTPDGVHYQYRPHRKASLPMTAEALLCRQYLGWPRDDGRLLAGAIYLLRNPIEWRSRGRNVYYWYYATQVLHHLGGNEWVKWNETLREVIPRHQTISGRENGSWSPIGDEHGGQGGRLYTTCLSIYLLEVYYRHMPVYAPP